jgi:hypothetical protein
MKKILAAAALAFVLSAAVAGTASAAPRLEGARWTCAPIAVSVNLSGLTGTQQRDALAAVRVAAHAVAAAHAVRTVTQTLRTPSAYAYGRGLLVSFLAPTRGLLDGNAGATWTDDNELVRSYATVVVARVFTGRELRGTITHELGYAFGLAHSADPLDVRSTTWTKGQRTAFTASELRILAARYAGCGQT